MANFLELQTIIEDAILRPDVNTQVKEAINKAIARYSKARLWFIETRQDFNTTQGDWFYTTPVIPDDIRQIDYLRITVNNVYYDVLERDVQFIISANVNNNQGQPVDWAWYDRSIYFYPIPQDTYPISIFYQKSYAPLVDPTDSNDWTEILEAQDLIIAETLRRLYKYIILDADKAAEYNAEAKEAMQVLQEISESITGMNGAIKATAW